MPNSQLLDCFQPGQGLLDRVNYFPRQLLTAADMVADQDYFRQKLRRHNRFLHGWGVVCGLGVSPASLPDAPWRVRIEGGYALGPHGNEIYVPERVFLDLARCGPGAATDPCAPDRLRRPDRAAGGGPVFVAIRYEECFSRPVRVTPAGCACDETACEYSRIRDSFLIECLPELPPSHEPGPAGPSLCDFVNGQQLAPCLPCPPDAWVILAQVDLPASPATDITAAQINNFVRRRLYSTAVLQEMLIACCCQTGEADLAVTKSVVRHELSSDGGFNIIAYRIEITNNGPASAQNITVIDRLATTGTIADVSGFTTSHGSWTNTEFVSASSQAEFTAEIPELSVQATATLEFEARFRGQQLTMTNTAEVLSETPDPNFANNISTVDSTGLSP